MIRKLFGMVFPALKPSSSRRDELETLLADSSADRASFDAHEGSLLRNILGLRDLNASDVMIPRADIVSVGMSESFSEIIAQMTAANHSRLPVRRGTLDDIAGIIHIKDVFAHLHAGRAPDVSTLLRPALFVAPTIRLLDLLHEMRLRRRHLALVVDEFGGVDGLITIEDLVEEIVGEIEDEHDEAVQPKITVNDDGTILAEARLEVEALEILRARCYRQPRHLVGWTVECLATSESGWATPIAYESWTSARLHSPAFTTDFAIHRHAYAAERATCVGSLPEKAPPPCAPQPPYVSMMILRPVRPASPCGPPMMNLPDGLMCRLHLARS